MDMEQKVNNIVKRYIWFFAGLLLCLAAALMKNSGGSGFDRFLGNNEVYEFSQEELKSSTNTCIYNSETDAYVTVGNKAKKTFQKIPEARSWSYLYLNVSNLNVGYSDWNIVYFDKQKNKISEQSVRIVSGDNMITIANKEPFRWVKIVIKNQPGVVFTLNSLQLRESAVFLDQSVILLDSIFYFISYLLISTLIFAWKKAGTSNLIEILQYAFLLPGNYFGSRIGGRLRDRTKNRWRVFLFGLLFLFMMVWNVTGLYAQKETYKYGILGCLVILVLAALISWEQPLRYISWNGMIPKTWLALWLMVCVSDFVVSKFYKFTGYAFLFGVGFFFFLWNNMKRPQMIRNNLMRGLEWTLPIITVYCVLFRQKKIGVLYNGPFLNREMLAAYALMTLIAFLSELYRVFLQENEKNRKRKIVLFGVGAAASAYYLYESYTLICIFAAALVILLLGVLLLKTRKDLALGMAGSLRMIAIAVICSIVVIFPLNLSLNSLPQQLGTNLVYEKEKWETRLDAETIAAIQAADPSVLEGVEQSSEVGLKQIWIKYLGESNLFGHNGVLYVGHIKTMACTGFLEMAYRYGIFILIPYSLLLLGCLFRAYREREYLMLATTLAYGIVMLTQNVELPFAQPLWIVFYLGMGNWFAADREKQEAEDGEIDHSCAVL